MPKPVKVRMNVSIASATWAYQPGMVVLLDAEFAAKLLGDGRAERVDKDTPLSGDDLLADLSAEEALHHLCSACERRMARYVLENRPYCPRCYRAALG
jgi:hypothetical protein